MPPAPSSPDERIRTVATTVSTNDDVALLATQGAPEGTWLRAERQAGGRGRQGREWRSPAGNLYASTLVRLAAGDPDRLPDRIHVRKQRLPRPVAQQDHVAAMLVLGRNEEPSGLDLGA